MKSRDFLLQNDPLCLNIKTK